MKTERRLQRALRLHCAPAFTKKSPYSAPATHIGTPMAFRVIVILIALIAADAIAADAYFWRGRYMQLTINTAQHFAADFNYQLARLVQPLH
jgi:hypothetical protein